MKYEYHFVIEDTEKELNIVEMHGRGISRSKKSCLKSIRRDIRSSIKEMIDRIEKQEEENKGAI